MFLFLKYRFPEYCFSGNFEILRIEYFKNDWFNCHEIFAVFPGYKTEGLELERAYSELFT